MNEKFMRYLPHALIGTAVLGITALTLFDTDTLLWIFYRLLWLVGLGAVYAAAIIGGRIALKKAKVIIPGKTGLYFDVLTWEPTKIVVSGLIGFTIAALLGLFGILDAFSPFTGWMLIAITVVMAYFVWQPEKDESGNLIALIVPEAEKAAYMLPFGLSSGKYLGGIFAVYFMTSRYPAWNQKWFFRSKKVMEPFTDKDGFLEMDKVQFVVWDNREALPGTPERTRISAPAKNRSEVTGQLTLVIKPFNPVLMLNSKDPAVDLGDRARQEFRELAEQFVDTDLPSLQSHLPELLLGKRLVTFCNKKSATGAKPGSMIRNESGKAMYKIVREEEGETVEQVAADLTKRIFREVNPDTLKKNVAQNQDEANESTVLQLQYTVVSVKHPLKDLLQEIGYELVRVTFADIEFAKKVQEASAAASAELDERISQLASAITIKAVSTALLPSAEEANNPWYQQAQIIAAAQDDKSGNIKILLMPGSGSNNLTGAVVGANIVGGDK